MAACPCDPETGCKELMGDPNPNPGGGGPSYQIKGQFGATVGRTQTVEIDLTISYSGGHTDPILLWVNESPGEPNDATLSYEVVPRQVTTETAAKIRITAAATTRLGLHSLRLNFSSPKFSSWETVGVTVVERGSAPQPPGWQAVGGLLGAGYATTEASLAGSQTQLFAAIETSRNPAGGEGSGGPRISHLYRLKSQGGTEDWEGIGNDTLLAQNEAVTQPHVALAPDGTAYFSIVFTLGTVSSLRLYSLAPGARTLTSVNASVNGGGPFVFASSLAVDDGGRVHLGWIAGGQALGQTYNPAQRTWSGPQAFSSLDRVNELVLVAGDRMHAVTVETGSIPSNGTQVRVYAQSDMGQIESRGTLNQGRASHGAVSAALDSNGDLLVAYQELLLPAGGQPGRVRVRLLPQGADASVAFDRSRFDRTPPYDAAARTQLVIGRDHSMWLGLVPNSSGTAIISRWNVGRDRFEVLELGLPGRTGVEGFAMAHGPEGGIGKPAGITRLISSSGTGSPARRADVDMYRP